MKQFLSYNVNVPKKSPINLMIHLYKHLARNSLKLRKLGGGMNPQYVVGALHLSEPQGLQGPWAASSPPL